VLDDFEPLIVLGPRSMWHVIVFGRVVDIASTIFVVVRRLYGDDAADIIGLMSMRGRRRYPGVSHGARDMIDSAERGSSI